jgi:hypothetical protein
MRMITMIVHLLKHFQRSHSEKTNTFTKKIVLVLTALSDSDCIDFALSKGTKTSKWGKILFII